MSVLSRKMLLPVILILSAVVAVYSVFEISGRNINNAEKVSRTSTDHESIGRGKELFNAKCSFCHDAYSTRTRTGPGLKSILKKEKLPFSKRSSTPGNIILQLKQPVDKMPAFEYLSEEEISDILAFLHTL